MAVVSIKGGKVHHGDDVPACDPRMSAKFETADAVVTCKRCLKRAAQHEETVIQEQIPVAQSAVEIRGTLAETSTLKNEKSADMADAPTTNESDVVQEIRDGIERLNSLLEAENDQGAEELATDLEAQISALKGPGSVKLKKALRGEISALRTGVTERKQQESESTVATLETQDYRSEIDGAETLIEDAASRISDAVQTSIKVSELAGEIAEAKLRIGARIKDKNGNPDIYFRTHAAKEAARDMFQRAGEIAGVENNLESQDALKRIIKSVQNKQGDARTRYVRALDDSPEEAALFAKALEAHPDASPSDAVFEFHNVDRETRMEKRKALLEAGQKAIADGEDSEDESGSEGDGSAEADAFEGALKVATAAKKAVNKFRKTPLEGLSEEQREQLEAQAKELEDAAREIRRNLI